MTAHLLARESRKALPDVPGLESYWSRYTRRSPPGDGSAWMADRILLDVLGLGIEQAHEYLRSDPDFESFRDWIVATAGRPDRERLERYAAWLAGAEMPERTAWRIRSIDEAPPVLDPADLEAWARDGYVVLRRAISREQAAAAASALWKHIGASPDDPDSWYRVEHKATMIQLFQQEALEPARRSPRVHKAFAQLWGTADLWATTDRMGFNPPERPGRPFAGAPMHWDVSLATPLPFATQAVLYLTDTEAEQGALRLVPGFHRRIESWIAALPPGAGPREQDLSREARAIGAEAGDLIIWRQDLPHGASPNRSARPRLVQYVNMYAPTEERQPDWI
ncbi:MAG TPA: phytanoyl-CoA dioxygenase family protein [Allosphingosinicella sp.]